MNLYAEIQKVTQIPQTDENIVFVRRKDSYEQNLKLKKIKVPQNVNLYDFNDTNDSSREICNTLPSKYLLHENEIASSIKEANYGINYSNEYLQDHWKIRQMEASLNIKSNNDCKNSTTEIHKQITILKTDNKNDIDCKDIEDKENILKECGLHKNAVIRSLLKSHIISLNDLQIPNNCKNIKIKNTNLQNQNIFSSNNLLQKDTMKLVQCPEDPEVFVQSLQVHGHIDENKYNDIDFCVPHIGKKQIVTSRQFFINMDDSDFDFIKKNIADKK
ncbi:hypothetical protein HZU73_03009 [Apis mellifera caucasica]|uniref:Uncharacterized protein LOC113219045 n=1 Tax=Apis mellifera TaxID=7460 RepID=A0A7M7MPR4_APIME|nr:uncharacterized protein LOC113219045 [Apis mellifera]XP_026299127.1 uncharacterized protein LOC113219045 [Apis mellifera]XP_026299128.1 uncharacterized protein LOC113219045 [Apis mellifera]KAG6801627.1 hypothetical protein HZU73_03009 [Apis mellifera caucasica]KAG9430316.1 hypothetical protein HZU67_07518 [Apis mellifera carnica]|eukprot:XP_026299126.1 uncharacterized protein LOC113219045 [Apis mellifera]